MTRGPLITDDRPVLNVWQTIFLAGSTAAFLDAAAAIFILGARPDKLFLFIASGIVGPDAFSGGVGTILLGIFLHFVISHVWAILFFLAWRWVARKISNVYVLAILFGILIWSFMNLLVVPLSKVIVGRGAMSLSNSVKGVLILIVAVAYPIVVFVRRYYLVKEELETKV
jgi:hypothetical protein